MHNTPNVFSPTTRTAKICARHQTHRLDEAPPTAPALARDYTLFAVSVDRVAPFKTEVEIDGADLCMKIDTGAAVSLINDATYSSLWSVRSPPQLLQSAVRLNTYSREELELMGEIRVRVHSGQLEEDLNLLVIKVNGPSLLSRDWLSKIRLDWESIRKLHH